MTGNVDNMAGTEGPAVTSHGPAWRMVLLAAIIQNVSTGLAFGSFGSLILSIEQVFGAKRDISSLTVGLLVVSFSLSGAVIGRFMARLRFRAAMLGGVGLCISAYSLLAVSYEMWQVLAIYAILLGPGVALTGLLVTNTLVARWVPDKTGRALGLVNMTIFVMVVPILCGLALRYTDLRGIYVCLALCELALVPVVLMVKEPPAAAPVQPTPAHPAGDRISLITRADFWLLVLAVGLMSGGASMKLAHFVPLLTLQGYSSDDANLLLGITGGAGVLGSIMFGWLADRIGPSRALIINALVQAAAWFIVLRPVGFNWLMVDAIAVGACAAGYGAVLGALIAQVYGAVSFAQVYGALSLLTLPFLMGMTPFAGYLYEVTGSYTLPFGIQIGGFVLAAVLIALIQGKSGAADPKGITGLAGQGSSGDQDYE